MTGADNIGSEELASKVAVTKKNVLGYRVIGKTMAGVKTPQAYETVTERTQDSHPAPELDIAQLKLFF